MSEPNGSRGDSAGDVSKVQAQRFIRMKRHTSLPAALSLTRGAPRGMVHFSSEPTGYHSLRQEEH